MGAGTLFTERGTIVTVFIVSYALTSFLAGYVRCVPAGAPRFARPLPARTSNFFA